MNRELPISKLEQEKDRLITKLKDELQDKLPGEPGAQLDYDLEIPVLVKKAIGMYFRRKFNLLYIARSKLLGWRKKIKEK